MTDKQIKKYNIIYADPPWEYKESGSTTNSRSLAKQHYNTMSTQDICNLPIRNIKTNKILGHKTRTRGYLLPQFYTN